MEYRLLGTSGSAVSALALGTLTFGNETEEEDSFAQLDRFTEVGGSLIDTADLYVGGRSEEIIGPGPEMNWPATPGRDGGPAWHRAGVSRRSGPRPWRRARSSART